MINTITLKKIWVYIKKYWYVPLILVAGVSLWVLSAGRSGRQIWELLENTRESAKKEIEAIERSNKEKEDKITEATETFIEEVKEIEEKAKVKEDQIKKIKEKQIKKDIEENNEDATELAQGLQDLLD